jgi:hypothetical protein
MEKSICIFGLVCTIISWLYLPILLVCYNQG